MVIDFDGDERRQREWLDAASRFVMESLASDVAVASAEPDALRWEDLSRYVGAGGISEHPFSGGMTKALELVRQAARRDALNPTAPGYLAYIPGGGLLATAIADLAADVLNRYTGLINTAPALVQMEQEVLSWLARQFGYGAGAGGMFTSGGSLANFAAVVAARDDARRRKGVSVAEFGRLRAYASGQAHHSVDNAFALAGLEDPVHVATDAEHRLAIDDLRARVDSDFKSGKNPFMVVATAGTTNIGAVDPLSEIADFCAERGLWLHIDAAYGGAFVLCPEEARPKVLGGIERADSITFDPHKGMFLPYGTGCLLFKKSPERAQSAARYMQGRTPIAPFDLELSRPYRGLRLWLPLMLHGAAAFRTALVEKLALARTLYDGVRRVEGVEALAPPALSIVAFRLVRRPDEAVDAWNARNSLFLDAINRSGETFLSATELGPENVFTLRACVLCHRTRRADIDRCIDHVGRAAQGLRGQAPPQFE